MQKAPTFSQREPLILLSSEESAKEAALLLVCSVALCLVSYGCDLFLCYLRLYRDCGCRLGGNGLGYGSFYYLLDNLNRLFLLSGGLNLTLDLSLDLLYLGLGESLFLFLFVWFPQFSG